EDDCLFYSIPDQSIDKMQVPYVASEILRTQKHTCEADIYSLGIDLYEITTGLSPYHNILHDVNLEIKIGFTNYWSLLGSGAFSKAKG
ncbi:11602_t:CDS:1, partial [Gigaspora margarita]